MLGQTLRYRQRLRQSLTLAGTKWQYTTGVKNLAAISPDTWNLDQSQLDRPGNQEIQLALLYSYHSNPPLYLQWQAYLRQYQPPTLVVWGKNDPCFRVDGAHAYKRDLQNLEFHLLDTGHFALEEEGDAITSGRLRQRQLHDAVPHLTATTYPRFINNVGILAIEKFAGITPIASSYQNAGVPIPSRIDLAEPTLCERFLHPISVGYSRSIAALAV